MPLAPRRWRLLVIAVALTIVIYLLPVVVGVAWETAPNRLVFRVVRAAELAIVRAFSR
jgi:hypothetical protein